MEFWSVCMIVIGVGYVATMLTKALIWLDTPRRRAKRA